ncbi:MAG: aminotransferase class I/II-fold pyridoxal phosphate-dependent enzyme [Deltaproteobacteria bacterium]|nr:aminotransferase class I/II-fold pyridoxal phosphate-dependent enzyme [Deltaproteobacteria bacterium]
MGNVSFDPAAALASAKHEFGEHGGVNMSIEASTTFTVMAAATMPEIFAGRRTVDRDGCFLYARHFNPTVWTLGRELAALEDAEAGYCCASGMAAIAATLLQLCDAGDHVVASSAVYGGTHALLAEFLPAKAGVTATFVPIDDLAAVEAAIGPRTRVLFTETVANPTLVVADLPALAAIAHRHGVALVVDNTFCPVIVTPTRHGADVVVHSLTKFINGASDLVAGAILGKAELIGRLMDLHTGALMLLGPTMDPRAAFEVSMRLPHLPLRIAEHSRRAQILCERLAALDVPVVYPGLPTHPQHALLARLANPGYGAGGLFTIDLGDRARAYRFMEVLQNEHRFGFMAVSLGYAETLMSCSASSTSSELDDAALAAAGIGAGLVRISIGYTGALEDRWAQLHAALVTVGMLGAP